MSHRRGYSDDQLRRDKASLLAGRGGSRMPSSQGRYDDRPSRSGSSDRSGYDRDGGYKSRYASSLYDDRRQNGVTAENATEEDVDYVRTQIRNSKTQTLQSSRNALRMVMDAETNATNTLNQLGSQSEALNRIEHRMDVTQVHAESAANKASHLKDLNRSMFRPAFKMPFTGKKRAEQKIAKAEANHLAAQKRQGDLKAQQEETRDRIRQGRGGAGGEYKSRKDYSPSSYGRYQFEADEADHEVERELASNLDNVSEATARLKSMAMSMNSEIELQNVAIGRVMGKTDKTGATIAGSSARLRSIK